MKRGHAKSTGKYPVAAAALTGKKDWSYIDIYHSKKSPTADMQWENSGLPQTRESRKRTPATRDGKIR